MVILIRSMCLHQEMNFRLKVNVGRRILQENLYANFDFSYEEHLDRMKKRMSAAVDSCVIELPLNNINEIVRYRTESKWRRRVWQVSYAKVEIGIFAALQLLNFIILMLVLYHWK
uniref:GOLD domain-containing protein n=1 Tax=Acrobeloides nanus TaxID=290746 RepID=A0A914EM14_9BILA